MRAMQLLELVALEANSSFRRRHLGRAGQRQIKAAACSREVSVGLVTVILVSSKFGPVLFGYVVARKRGWGSRRLGTAGAVHPSNGDLVD